MEEVQFAVDVAVIMQRQVRNIVEEVDVAVIMQRQVSLVLVLGTVQVPQTGSSTEFDGGLFPQKCFIFGLRPFRTSSRRWSPRRPTVVGRHWLEAAGTPGV